MFRFTLATAGVLALCVAARAQQPHPDLPYTTVSRIDPWTGAYSNTEYFYDRSTGQPTERGYWREPVPVYTAWWYGPPVVSYPPPALLYSPRPYGRVPRGYPGRWRGRW